MLANVYHPETNDIIPYAPRNLLKKVLSEVNLGDYSSQLMFSFVFEKHPSKDEKESSSKKKTNRGMLALE